MFFTRMVLSLPVWCSLKLLFTGMVQGDRFSIVRFLVVQCFSRCLLFGLRNSSFLLLLVLVSFLSRSYYFQRFGIAISSVEQVFGRGAH